MFPYRDNIRVANSHLLDTFTGANSPLFLCLSSSLAPGWDLGHRLTLNLVVFFSVLLGTGGTQAMTKLFWFWCQHNHVRGSEAEENASESHLKKEILQLFVHRAADEEEAEVRRRQFLLGKAQKPSSIFQPGASLVAARRAWLQWSSELQEAPQL